MVFNMKKVLEMYFKISLLFVVQVSLVFSSSSYRDEWSPSSDPEFRDRLIGSLCFIDADCPLAETTCQNNICDCRDGLIAVVEADGIARCHVDTNLECPSITTRCADLNAECTSEPFQTPSGWWSSVLMCRCKPGFIYNPTVNQCQIVMGHPCQTNTPCVSGNCNQETGLCSCPGFLIPSTDQLSCAAAIDANCASIPCADANSMCSELSSVCTCNNGFQPSQKLSESYQICRKRFGASCKEDPECADEYMECGVYSKGPATEENRACLCQSGYVPNGGRTSCLSPQGVMGGPCSVNNQCTSIFGRHAVCANNVCVCATGYIYDWKSTSCVRD